MFAITTIERTLNVRWESKYITIVKLAVFCKWYGGRQRHRQGQVRGIITTFYTFRGHNLFIVLKLVFVVAITLTWTINNTLIQRNSSLKQQSIINVLTASLLELHESQSLILKKIDAVKNAVTIKLFSLYLKNLGVQQITIDVVDRKETKKWY